MKKKTRTIAAGILLIGMFAMTSCNSKKEGTTPSSSPEAGVTNQAPETQGPTGIGEVAFDTVILTVGEDEVTYREVLLYILQLKNKYEPNLGKEIWSYEVESDKTFEAVAKEELLNEMVEIKIIAQQAAELEIELEATEEQNVADHVKEYLNRITQEDQEKYGITEEMVSKVLRENYMAEKVFAATTSEVTKNISDDDVKQIRLQQLVVLTDGTDKNGLQVALSEEDKKSALQRVKSLRESVVEAENFSSFASSNSDTSTVEFTMGKGDMPEIESAAFALQEGEVSQVIPTSYGYVILKMVSAYDEEATKEKKEQILEIKQNEAFATQYETWSAEYKVTQDFEQWDQITFDL